jgi:hypothetical protein
MFEYAIPAKTRDVLPGWMVGSGEREVNLMAARPP